MGNSDSTPGKGFAFAGCGKGAIVGRKIGFGKREARGGMEDEG